MFPGVQSCFQLLRIGSSSGGHGHSSGVSDTARDLYTFRPALAHSVFRLGRAVELCDVTLESTTVSRIHAELHVERQTDASEEEGWKVQVKDRSSYGWCQTSSFIVLHFCFVFMMLSPINVAHYSCFAISLFELYPVASMQSMLLPTSKPTFAHHFFSVLSALLSFPPVLYTCIRKSHTYNLDSSSGRFRLVSAPSTANNACWMAPICLVASLVTLA